MTAFDYRRGENSERYAMREETEAKKCVLMIYEAPEMSLAYLTY